MIKRNLVIFCCVLIISVPIFAASPGTSILNFLKINPGAKNAGLAEMNSCITSQSILLSPAILPLINYNEVSIQHLIYLSDLQYSLISYVNPNLKRSAMSISFGYLGMGSLPRTIYDASNLEGYVQTGSFNCSDMMLNIGYGRKIDDNFSIGVAVKGAQESIDNEKYVGGMVTISGMYYYNNINYQERRAPSVKYYSSTEKDWYVGFSLFNLGPQIKGYNLPSGVMLGGGGWINSRALIAGEAIAYMDSIIDLKAGVEYNITEIFFGRLGCKYSTKDHKLGTFLLSSITAGIGLNVDRYSFDYAWVPYGTLGQTHRITLTAKFGEPIEY